MKSGTGPMELAGKPCFRGLGKRRSTAPRVGVGCYGEAADGGCCWLPAPKEPVPVAGAELEKLGLLQKPDQRSASQPGSEASASINGRQRPLPAKLSIVPPGKGTDLKGPDPFFREPTNRMNLELRGNT